MVTKKSKNKKRKSQKKIVDPRTSQIVPLAGPVKIIKANGDIEFQKPLKPSKIMNKIYPSARPRKAI